MAGGATIKKRRGAGRPRAREAAARQQDLLNRATEVFLEYGYANASVAEIARRAGASKRTIYARYRTKADLFIAVIARKTQELQNVLRRSWRRISLWPMCLRILALTCCARSRIPSGVRFTASSLPNPANFPSYRKRSGRSGRSSRSSCCAIILPGIRSSTGTTRDTRPRCSGPCAAV